MVKLLNVSRNCGRTIVNHLKFTELWVGEYERVC